MTTPTTSLVSLASLALLATCGTEPDPAGLKLQAMSFKSSEWSGPVLLPAPANSRCQDQTPTTSKDELSLYFLSDRPGGFGNFVSSTGCMDNNDLWVARRSSPDGAWETAVNLGPGPVRPSDPSSEYVAQRAGESRQHVLAVERVALS